MEDSCMLFYLIRCVCSTPLYSIHSQIKSLKKAYSTEIRLLNRRGKLCCVCVCMLCTKHYHFLIIKQHTHIKNSMCIMMRYIVRAQAALSHIYTHTYKLRGLIFPTCTLKMVSFSSPKRVCVCV